MSCQKMVNIILITNFCKTFWNYFCIEKVVFKGRKKSNACADFENKKEKIILFFYLCVHFKVQSAVITGEKSLKQLKNNSEP